MSNCIRCGKTYKSENCLDNHINGIKRCKAIYIYIPFEIYQEKYIEINKLFQDEFNEMCNRINPVVTYGCWVCGKLYSSRNGLYKHRKNCMYDTDIDDVKDIKIENENINDGIQCKENNMQLNEYQHIEANKIEAHNMQNIGQYNNVNNSGNSINNITINLQNFNADYTEDILNYLSKNKKKQLVKKPQTALTDLYQMINIDNPKYRNVYISHPKDGYGMVFNDGEWQPITMNQLMEDIICKYADILYDITGDDSINVKQSHLDGITEMLDKLAENDSFTEAYKSQIKIITYKFKELLKESYDIMKIKSHNKLMLKRTKSL
jgi:hypothetical protein